MLVVGLALLLLLPQVFGCEAPIADERPFQRASVTLGHRSIPYAVYVPSGYSPKKLWPVILFLHGFKERGRDNVAQTRVGIGPTLREHPERFPCLVVMPQMPWSHVQWSGAMNDLALKALDTVVQKYHGDRSRLYLTGCSMGGCGCWRVAAAHPQLFAAVMPLCGRGKPAVMAPALKSLPIWVFHGAADHLMPVQGSRAMVQAIRAAGSTQIRYTEYPWVGHICWNLAYSDPSVIAWLLSQKRGSAGPTREQTHESGRS